MTELIAGLIAFNAGCAGGVLLVMALRPTLRHLAGASTAYTLWLIVPLCGLAALLPPLGLTAPAPLVDLSPAMAASAGAVVGRAFAWGEDILVWAWLAGAAATAALIAHGQAKFVRAARQGRAGPAVVGLWRPRIVLPADFARLYTDLEREAILRHEQWHIRRQDPRANGLVALGLCMNWFNPLLHIAARLFRIDQELACDAHVLRDPEVSRRTYAQALLKTQLVRQTAPLGCHWPAEALHPLGRRIQALERRDPGRSRRLAGGLLALLAGSAAAVPIWLSQPLDAWRRAGFELGSVLRVEAHGVAPDGQALTSDVALGGRTAALRTVNRRWSTSEYGLWTGARQQGDRIWVAAALTRGDRKLGVVSTTVAPGQSASLRVAPGTTITVRPSVRQESPDEAAARRAQAQRTVRCTAEGVAVRRCERAARPRTDDA